MRHFVSGLDGGAAVRVELICLLNAPTPAEREAARRLRSLRSAWVDVRVFEVERETLYASWNRGVKLSEAGVVGFWNVDDLRYPAAVVEGVRSVASGASLVYFPFWTDHRWRKWGFFPRRHRQLRPAVEFDIESFRRTFQIGPFFMFSKQLYRETGPFDEQFGITGDLDWMLRAIEVTPFTPGREIAGVFLNEFRGLSMSGSQQAVAEHNVIYARHGLHDLARPCAEELMAGYDVGRIHAGGAVMTLHGDHEAGTAAPQPRTS